MNTNNILTIDHMSKLYDKQHGINSISVTINSGEIVAFIGPNGAGKTTLVKSIAGLLTLSKGQILLNGTTTSSRVCKPHIGYMQNTLDFYEQMTVYEILNFICKVKLEGKFHNEIDSYLKKYELYEQRNAFIHELSLGMKKKLSIIMALLGSPQLILLDEPTNGVDTLGIIQLKNDLIKCSQKGSIVIVTSHVLDFIEKICSRCIFLKKGNIEKDLIVDNTDTCLETIYEQLYILSLETKK